MAYPDKNILHSVYGESIVLSKENILSYDDIVVTYTGVEYTTLGLVKTQKYSFEITSREGGSSEEKLMVYWSPGTGELASQKFVFQDEGYSLEVVDNRTKVVIYKILVDTNAE